MVRGRTLARLDSGVLMSPNGASDGYADGVDSLNAGNCIHSGARVKFAIYDRHVTTMSCTRWYQCSYSVNRDLTHLRRSLSEASYWYASEKKTTAEYKRSKCQAYCDRRDSISRSAAPRSGLKFIDFVGAGAAAVELLERLDYGSKPIVAMQRQWVLSQIHLALQ